MATEYKIAKDLEFKNSTETVEKLLHFFEEDKLELQPGFQRQSVWKDKDRQRLIESILRGYPLPAIFLHKRNVNNSFVYDVIDGKQRLEAILDFCGRRRGKSFVINADINGIPESRIDYALLKKRSCVETFHAYEIPVIEVKGDLSVIIDLFVKINTTGKPLTAAEKNNARFNDHPILKIAKEIASRKETYFLQSKVFSTSQISRFKSVEFVCELLWTAYTGQVMHKKATLEKVLANPIPARELAKAKERVIRTLTLVERMFPRLKETRFIKASDFYVLCYLISVYDADGLILSNKKSIDQAWQVLVAFSLGVGRIETSKKEVKGSEETDELFREYYRSVRDGTDDRNKRQIRVRILDGLLRSIFERKDDQRLFSVEQRRILWHSTEVKKCAKCGCKLTWDNFTVDHVLAHSKGGRTDLKNAALLCVKCNSRKGAR